MSEFEIDFEWPVAKCEFRPATAEEISDFRARYSYHLRGISEAEWPLYLGRIVRTAKAKDHRPKKEAMERAVTVLVECKQTPFHEVALKVARALGTLQPPPGDYVFTWYGLALQLQSMFEGKDFIAGKEYIWPQPQVQRQGDLGIYLVPGKDKRPVLALRPDNLKAALIFYAARMIATGTTFNVCKNCQSPFLSGGGRGRNKKRGDARFCSDECRYRYHNESRRKAR
jgi:hypothetical protein